jgi:hypothetical protein
MTRPIHNEATYAAATAIGEAYKARDEAITVANTVCEETIAMIYKLLAESRVSCE